MRNFLLLTICLACFATSAHAQTISLVKDLVPGVVNPGIAEFAQSNGDLFFIGQRALWKTNGDSSSTVLLKEFFGIMKNVVSFGNCLYFIASDSVHGWELWKSDGTIAGTNMVKDINPIGDGIALSNIQNERYLEIFNGEIYFIANDNVHGSELWHSDGTSAGTNMFMNLNPHSGNMFDSNGVFYPLRAAGSRLYFCAQDSASDILYPYSNFSLWSTDGTIAGTLPVAEAVPLYSEFVPAGNTMYFGGVYFTSNDTLHGLMQSDGTPQGTTLISEYIQATHGTFAALGGKFIMLGQPEFFSDFAVFALDTQTNDVTILRDSFSLQLIPPIHSAFLTTFNNQVFFSGYEGPDQNRIWRTDGTVPGTSLLFSDSTNICATHFVSFDNRLFFKGLDSARVDIWETDGTAAGSFSHSMPGSYEPAFLHPLWKGRELLSPVFPYNNELYFVLTYDSTIGPALYKLSIPVNVSAVSAKDELQIHPNPATQILYVGKPAKNIRIFDISGKTVMTGQGAEVDISALSPGFYIVISEDGNNIRTGKFIRQ